MQDGDCLKEGIDLLQMAHCFAEMEKGAAKYYQHMAEVNPKLQDLFLKLATEESQHSKIFALLGSQLAQRQTEDLNNYKFPEYLKAILNKRLKRISFSKGDTTLTASSNISEVFEFAYDAEEDAILLYLGLKEVVKDEESQKILEKIIGEEMQHIAWLNETKREMGA
ncbi:MAG: hypothetical protein A2504_00810 [Bdellovibrionales bacterium RIFOXYD12_FULL_39_22]|nr:MAG: hypothetical protein A2385_03430 [Bdellovibrionales bacterium RIFOXYB1_FULL_39_21]OFZ42621.1 MAG: hypothetical protein A2485_09875 [Bdellovibrionales bacterium RIFOXYC12_FULL_39_17]OFZ47111.1 MAG: hypothetical protein A2404_15420 [Bdellovibrionales bacterium RIFOXYC1_FULL_39_130]OFZ75359.1 MAG: hypothetical protein A2560_14195 [Bdellovibrionales bacterium RIFOXYD1_FULL_39_84]OFZ93310.1 MAG: hypothetical protein A2504_00810 [Bdellovibrionales bacterium RIFOXYD12_FULL_39_22]HLE10014.1 fe